MAMQPGSNKTCTIDHKDKEGAKSTPQNFLERVFVIIPQRTQVNAALSISVSGGGATTGMGLSGTPRGTSPVLGWETSVLEKLEGQGGLFSGISIKKRYLEKDKGLHCPRQSGADGQQQHPTGLRRSAPRRGPSVLYCPKTYVQAL